LRLLLNNLLLPLLLLPRLPLLLFLPLPPPPPHTHSHRQWCGLCRGGGARPAGPAPHQRAGHW
jgi:hypothetical protein